MNNKDILLEKFFDKDRWTYALKVGVRKDICHKDLSELTSVEARLSLYHALRDGTYKIAPPRTAQIPKGNGEFRTVYINEPKDRVFLSIVNDLLFDVAGNMVHPRSKAYQKGLSCGEVVQEVSRVIKYHDKPFGFKADLSKYFDSVPIEFIDKAFDEVELKLGHSAIIDVLREYYHNDNYFDTEGVLRNKYQSLKQGSAVASWLANVVLYHIDEELSRRFHYWRYSDDILLVGHNYESGLLYLKDELANMQMTLNPKKVEILSPDKWFKFLGFSLKKDSISIAETRLKTFVSEIRKRTIDSKYTYERAINEVMRYLYVGDGEHAWANTILPIVNNEHDIQELNGFVLDCLRAIKYDKKRVGGLGFNPQTNDYCVMRGKGRDVKSLRKASSEPVKGYLSLWMMKYAGGFTKSLYDAFLRQVV